MSTLDDPNTNSDLAENSLNKPVPEKTFVETALLLSG